MKDVVARITGGLGNQLFSYAVARGIAERTGRAVRLDLTDFLIFYGGRKYQLGHFVGPSRTRRWNLFRTALFLAAWVVNKRVCAAVFPALLRLMNVRVVQSERILEYDEAFVDEGLARATESLYLIGVYGHLPYLASEEALRRELQLVDAPVGRNLDILRQVSDAPSVSVHIRRSDYLGVANGTIVLDVDYYRHAMQAIRRVEPNPLWVVFSDDIPWCRASLAELADAVFVEGNGDAPWEDLRLMAACKHHIIANSTFSWWGAYLGRDAGGTTVYPDTWFPTAKTSPTTVKPEWVSAPSFVGRRCV
jgi:hypothetical protein